MLFDRALRQVHIASDFFVQLAIGQGAQHPKLGGR